ncbi:MAG: hypothetical protein HKN28_18460 [Alphaproteobacteria bacterium]|nr:hypothetical protein [Alphaproteobacteria bacterium]
MNKIYFIAAAGLFAAGLAPEANAEEPQLAMRNGTLETMVRTDFDSTWDELVSELEGRDYEIGTLAKQDRTMQVLFQATIPSHFVDCGEISVSSKHSQFGDRNYKFLAANSVRYLVADERVDELVDVERRTNLNAIANISLTPVGQGTMVRVDAVYSMNFRTREFGRNIEPRKSDETLNFDSAVGASTLESVRQGATSKTVTVECRANGTFERNIVSVLGNAS